MPAQFTLPIQPVDKGNGTLCNLEPHRLGPHHHLHLETIPLALRTVDDLLQHTLLVQPEAPRQITHTRHKHNIRDQVRRPRCELPEQIPPIHPALDAIAACIPRARDDVCVRLLLDANHLGNELGVVAEVRIHDDDIVAAHVLQPVHVCGSQTQLAGPRLEVDVFGAPEGL